MGLLPTTPMRVVSEPAAATVVATIAKPIMIGLAARDWAGQSNLPPFGGCIIAANHVSHLDPLCIAHFVHDAGRVPNYLAKESLFHTPVLGWALSNSGSIPVHREATDARAALADAIAALEAGACLMVYPEGTITRDPDFWPMQPKNGVARLALATGAPVIPLAQWGAHEVFDGYTKRFHPLPRKTIGVRAGPPVDISEFEGHEWTRELLDACAAKIMTDVMNLLAEIRGEPAPAQLAPRPTRSDPTPSVPAATPEEIAAAEAAGRAAANRPPRGAEGAHRLV